MKESCIWNVVPFLEPTFYSKPSPGNKLVAAGYCVFGTACMMVLSMGSGVHGFTLDPSIGEFILTAQDMTIPQKVCTFCSIYFSNKMTNI